MEIITIPTLRALLHRDKENGLERGTVGGKEIERTKPGAMGKRGDNGRQGDADPI